MAFCRAWTFVAFVCATALSAIAQQLRVPDNTSVQVSGSASITEDQYSIAGTNTTVAPRQPPNQLRVMLAPIFTAMDWSMPVIINFSTWQTNILTPSASSQTIAQILENPLNTVLFAPHYHWVQAYLGTYAPKYSDLSIGNAPLFGGGVELHPGALHFSAFAGTQQRAVDPDSANKYTGAFARRIYGAKAGLDFNNANTIDINIISMHDDNTSSSTTAVLPQAGTLLSINAVHNANNFLLRGEVAGGAFTSNTNPNAPDSATKFRMAAFAFAQYNERTWDVSAKLRYLGDGFIPIGYLFQPSNLLEFTLSPSGRLFDNHVVLNATIGLRGDNMSGNNVSSRSTMISSFDGFAKFDNEWTLAMNMTNFGMNMIGIADSIPTIRTTALSINVAPRWTHVASIGTHTVSANVMFDQYSDQSINTGAITDNDTRTLSAQYALAFASMPLTLRGTLSQFLNHLTSGPLTVTTFMLGASYPLLDGALAPSVDLAYAGNAQFGRNTDSQILFRFRATYRVTKKINASIAGTLNLYTYGSPTLYTSTVTSSFTEEYVRSAISVQL